MTERFEGVGRRARRGRSILLRLVLLLLLGGLASLGVAVFAALASSRETATLHWHPTDAEDLRWWNESTPVGRDLDWALVDPRRRRVHVGLESITFEARATSRETGQPDVATAERIRAGWPRPCLEGVTWFLMRATSPPSSPEIVDQGLLPIEVGNGSRLIPTRPILGGLVLDSIVMATVFGGIGLIPSATRGMRGVFRRRAGRCPSCGYPGLEVRCSECGFRRDEPRGSC